MNNEIAGKLSNKDILNEYSDKELDRITKVYEDANCSDVSVDIDTYELFNEEDTVVMHLSYKDSKGDLIYHSTAFIPNDQYLGTIDIVSLNKDWFEDVVGMFDLNNCLN